MDDRHFDNLSRWVGTLPLPRLPRRGVMHLLGGATLAGALGLLSDPDAAAQKKDKDASAEKKNKKCKKEGKKCDKKKCKKKDKKCCCKDLKCKNDRCEGGNNCPTDANFNDEFGNNGSGQGNFNNPFGIAIDEDGFLYVTDNENFRVQIFDQNGDFEDEFGEMGTGEEQFADPLGIGVNENSNGNLRVIVADPGQTNDGRKLRRFDDNGNLIGDPIGRAALTDPTGVGIDPDGNIWVTDNVNAGEVFLYDEDGGFITSFNPDGNGALNNPQGIAIFEDDDENATFVYVADTGNNRVVKFEYVSNDSDDGLDFVDDAGSSGSDSDEFNQPTGIAVDECGNVWVADRLNNRIQQLDKNLNFESRFSTSLDLPTGVAINPDGDRLYVVNSGSDSVSIFDLDD